MLKFIAARISEGNLQNTLLSRDKDYTEASLAKQQHSSESPVEEVSGFPLLLSTNQTNDGQFISRGLFRQIYKSVTISEHDFDVIWSWGNIQNYSQICKFSHLFWGDLIIVLIYIPEGLAKIKLISPNLGI